MTSSKPVLILAADPTMTQFEVEQLTRTIVDQLPGYRVIIAGCLRDSIIVPPVDVEESGL